MRSCAAAIAEQRDYLTQLDAAIGDADHGANMTRGFSAVEAKLDGLDGGTPPGKVLVPPARRSCRPSAAPAGRCGASALRRAGKALGDGRAGRAGDELVDALDAAVAAVVELGAAEPGDKTMVDALAPGRRRPARRARRRARRSARRSAAARAAAEEGMRATVPMLARKGRASYLGERSIGHQDPGATSTALIMAALERAVAGGAMSEHRRSAAHPASPGAAIGPAWTRDASGARPAGATAPRRSRRVIDGLRRAAAELAGLVEALARRRPRRRRRDRRDQPADGDRPDAGGRRDPRGAGAALPARRGDRARGRAARARARLAGRPDAGRAGRRPARRRAPRGRPRAGRGGRPAGRRDRAWRTTSAPARSRPGRGRIAAIVLAGSGTTAHAAIVARSLHVPLVTAAGRARAGDPDGRAGRHRRRPRARVAAARRRRRGRGSRAGSSAVRVQAARRPGRAPPPGRDDRRPRAATAGERRHARPEVDAALEAGADGVGLLRSELAFLDARAWPTEEEHVAGARAAARPARDRIATVRTLDFGADKTPPFLAEQGVGGLLGARGIRLALAAEAASTRSCARLLRVAGDSVLRILVPMVAETAEVDAVRERALGPATSSRRARPTRWWAR